MAAKSANPDTLDEEFWKDEVWLFIEVWSAVSLDTSADVDDDKYMSLVPTQLHAMTKLLDSLQDAAIYDIADTLRN